MVAQCEAKLAERARFLCRGRNPSDVTDLLQDTYERALRSFHTYDRSAPPLPWLSSILVRRFLDVYRRDKRYPHQEFTEAMHSAMEEAGPAEPWAEYTMDDVWHAVDQLPEDLRAVMWLKDKEGLSYAEIARRLGIPSATVGTRLFRARKQLKEILLKPESKDGEER